LYPVIGDGNVEEAGSHEELLASSRLYTMQERDSVHPYEEREVLRELLILKIVLIILTVAIYVAFA
jgi:hypothetical protein